MRILIAHGSNRGGTEGLAEWLGGALEQRGFEVLVLPARGVRSLSGYDAVVVGGALYVFRWHADARRFVRRHRRALERVPVWFFSSGPLDDSAVGREILPVRFVRRAMQRIGAMGHRTFGGRLAPPYRGPLPLGDWRNREEVEEWADEIAAALRPAVSQPVD